MLLSKLILLPVAVASSVTIYMHSVPSSSSSQTPVIPSPIPLAQIDYDVDQPKGTVTSFTPPHGSYTNEHLLRVGLHDSTTGAWRGIVTSAANFADEYKKKFVVFVDEKGEVYHVGFSTSAKGTDKEDVFVQVVKRAPGMKPVLNKPVVLNAEGKIATPGVEEKTFLQK
jgi:hypothetical protein